MMGRVTIDFYRAEITPTTSFQTVESVFEAALAKESLSIDEASHSWEIRQLERSHDGGEYRGALAKLRHTGLPMKARKGGKEESLGLADDEGLLEKAYFTYFSKDRLLLWQANKMCGSPVRLRSIFRAIHGADINFNTVVQAGAVERLLDGKGVMKNFEIAIARPTNPDVFPTDKFTDGIMSLMSETGGDRMTINVKVDGRFKNGNPMNEGLRKILSLISERDEIETAKVELVDDEGNSDPVDLVADRIRAYYDVQQNGKYPNPEAMYAAIRASFDQKAAELAAVFGAQHEQHL